MTYEQEREAEMNAQTPEDRRRLFLAAEWMRPNGGLNQTRVTLATDALAEIGELVNKIQDLVVALQLQGRGE